MAMTNLNLFLARFLLSVKIGVLSSKAPYVDTHIETMDCGLMTTETFLTLIEEGRNLLHKNASYLDLQYDIQCLFYGAERNDKFLKLITGKGSEYWREKFSEQQKLSYN